MVRKVLLFSSNLCLYQNHLIWFHLILKIHRAARNKQTIQNAMMLQSIERLSWLKFLVRFIDKWINSLNFTACNIVSMFKRGLYTVKNYGIRRNCSVSIIYPERIQLLSVDVGVTGYFRRQEEEIGMRSKVRTVRKIVLHITQ